jgi:hypothetical protein
MISVIWNGMGVPLIWTLLPSAGNSNTKARTDLLDRLQGTFSDLKIASLMGDREFIIDAWMAYLRGPLPTPRERCYRRAAPGHLGGLPTLELPFRRPGTRLTG